MINNEVRRGNLVGSDNQQ